MQLKVSIPHGDELPGGSDVVIVGGGIVGASTAFFCSRLGLDTVLIEAGQALGGLTTAVSTECFRAQFESEANIKLMLASIDLLAHFSEVVGLDDVDINLRRQGYLYLTTSPEQAETDRRIVQRQHAAGLQDVELLSGDEVRARFPYLSDQVVAARYRAGDGWLSVHELLYGFVRASRARFLLDTGVTGITRLRSGLCVHTTRGDIQAASVVIAAGPFSASVAEMAGVDLPLLLLRRHRLAVLKCDGVPPNAPFTMDDDTGVYWRPEGAGALMGKAYEDVPEEPTHNVAPDWGFPAMVLDPESPCRASRLSPFWAQAPNLMARSNINLAAGQYSYTPDQMPCIGSCSRVPGLFFNAGYAGFGIMGAPEGGRRLAEIIAGKSSEAGNPFAYERFLASAADAGGKPARSASGEKTY